MFVKKLKLAADDDGTRMTAARQFKYLSMIMVVLGMSRLN